MISLCGQERRMDPEDGLDYSLDELRSKYDDVYEEHELLEYFCHTCLQLEEAATAAPGRGA